MPDHQRINWDPHDQQAKAYRSGARFRTIAAGRRSGKTTLAGVETVERALSSGAGWMGAWVSPNHSITETGFRMIDSAVDDRLIDDAKQSPPYRHEFATGARLDYLTTGGSANVSEGYNWIVIDEAAKGVPREAWIQELRPTLSNRDGDAMFISTPDGRGWFHEWYQRGQSPDYPNVASFRWSTYDAPHIPDAEVDEARGDMPERLFEQEYLALFQTGGGAVFDVETAREEIALPEGPEPAEASSPPYRLGVDLARSEDYLAIIGLGADGVVSHITRERDLGWSQIQRRVERVAEAHDGPRVAIDATRDNKLVADLEAGGLRVEPVTFSASRKATLVENLAAGIEADEVRVPAETILETELAVFEYQLTDSGNVRYDAPEGHHDDTVDALAMANDLPAADGPASATIDFGTGDGGGGEFGDSAIGAAIEEIQNRRRR